MDLRSMTMVIQTPNFHPDTDPKLLCTCGHDLCDQRSVNQYALDHVQFIRWDLNESMVITSGGRCPYHPNELGKTGKRDHRLCTTVDVKCLTYMYETKLKVLAGRHGATRVAGGVQDGFVHISWTKTERDDVPTWEY